MKDSQSESPILLLFFTVTLITEIVHIEQYEWCKACALIWSAFLGIDRRNSCFNQLYSIKLQSVTDTGLISMEDRESKSAAPFAMDEDQGKKEQESLITRKRKRKGIPRKLVLCNEKFSISESSGQNPTDFFSIEEGFDLNRIGGDFCPCSLIIRAGEDIIAKLTSFCESYFCNCYILSATGCVARASIFQGGIASTYEGCYEIVSLSGHVSRPSNLSRGSDYRVAITLAVKNDSLFGGYVSGPLIATTNVQTVLWKFTSPSEGEASVQDSSSTVESPVTKMEVP